MIQIDIITLDPVWNRNVSISPILENIKEAIGKNNYIDIPDKSELSLVLSNSEHIKKLNLQYRGKNKPTNVLSFPLNNSCIDNTTLLGDIIVAYDVLQEESFNSGKNFESHLCHIIIHGLLHILGYDHENNEDAIIMEELEIKLLEKLGISNPYK